MPPTASRGSASRGRTSSRKPPGGLSAYRAAPAADGSATGPTWRRRTRRDRLARGNHARPPASGAVMSAGAGGCRSRASRACSRNAETLPGGEDGGDGNPIRADAAAIERAAKQAEGRTMLRRQGRPAARPEHRREARRRLDGPTGRIAEIARHDEPVEGLGLEEALGTRVEGEGVRIPDETVHARELGRPRSETDQEHAARADARHVDHAREAERDAGVEVEAVQLGEQTQVVADRASRNAGRGRIRQPAPGPLGAVGNGEPVGGERARRRGVEIEPRLDRGGRLCRGGAGGGRADERPRHDRSEDPDAAAEGSRPATRPPRAHRRSRGHRATRSLGRSAVMPLRRARAPRPGGSGGSDRCRARGSGGSSRGASSGTPGGRRAW